MDALNLVSIVTADPGGTKLLDGVCAETSYSVQCDMDAIYIFGNCWQVGLQCIPSPLPHSRHS